jgi:multiple sugar transport system permease protein
MSDRRRLTPRRIRARLGDGPLIVLAVLVLLPILWMISASLRPVSQTLTTPPTWIPEHVTWQYYGQLGSSDFPVLTFLHNSIVVSVVSTFGMLATSSLAGYAFAKIPFRGRNLLFAALLIALMVPIQVTAVPLYVIMNKLGLINSLWSLMLPALLGAFAPGLPGAFGIFMMRQFFQGIPDSLIEAARIDGASEIRIFLRVVLPLAKPALASLAIITFVYSWNEYFEPLIFLNSPGTMTLPVGIQSLRPAFGQGSSLVLAAVTVAMVPVIVIFVFGQRWLVRGFIRAGLNE